jgi:hypothetical protein
MSLPKFTLQYDEKSGKWDLDRDSTGRTVRSFDTKDEATKAGALKRAIGGEGSVKIQLQNGRFEEERTFPGSKDPRRSKG